jgi:hypothetical protein
MTVTQVSGGDRDDPVDGDTGFGFNVTRDGYLIAGSFGFDAKASEIDVVFGELATCQKVTTSSWDFTFILPGERSLFAADVTGLIVPGGLIGELDLNTAQGALLASAGEDFSGYIEGEVTLAGQKPLTFYRAPITISRDVITASATAPESLSPRGGWLVNGAAYGITGLAGGGATKLDGVTTTSLSSALYSAPDATHGWGVWELTSGTTAENVAGGVLRPDDYATTTNEKVWLRRL